MNTATIFLSGFSKLKPDKDPTSPSSYRLLLINTDTKIISKALAPRIETVTPSIIDSDQTGFIIRKTMPEKEI